MDSSQFIAVWLHGRPAKTTISYRREVERLEKSLDYGNGYGKPFEDVTLEDLQRHLSKIDHLSAASRRLAVAAIRSFYAFHVRVGTMERNPALGLQAVAMTSNLAERILTEAEVHELLRVLHGPAERAMLRVLYLAGLRASELCGLEWRHLAVREGGGQITVIGKGAKLRTVLIPEGLYGDLAMLRSDEAKDTAAIFHTARGGRMTPRALLRVVKAAAEAAGLSERVSCHWLRHSHASHALDAGAPITLVRDTVGHASLATTNKYAHARPNDGSARFLRTEGAA